MKTFRNLLMLFVVAYCSVSGYAKTQVVLTHDEVSVQDPITKQYSYFVELKAVDGFNEPFVGIDIDIINGKWLEIELKDTDGNGYYELRFTSYNKPVHLYYWDRVEQRKVNEKDKLGNPYQTKSKCDYFDPSTGCIVLLPVDGKIYHKDEVTLPAPPGEGDGMTRFVDKGDVIELYTWYGYVNKPFVSAFVMLEADGLTAEKQWKERKQDIIDANAWAMSIVSKNDILAHSENKNLDLRLGYGVVTASGERLFPNPKNSSFVNSAGDGITIPAQKLGN